MNASQIHLALNHVPLFFSIVGGLVLLYGFIKKQEQIKFLSLYFMTIAALFTIPVYLTGEGTEESVEKLPGVSENLIEAHEEMAKIGLIVIIITGIAALITLFVKKRISLLKPSLILCAFLTFISFGVMAQTARLGGKIRHSEIRNGAVISTENEAGENAGNEQKKEKEDKDDD
jgi:uncharacterized membrane protein